MVSQEVSVSIPKHMASHVVMKVRATGVGWMLFRIRCAIPLVWLASKVAGVGFECDLERSKGWS